MNNIYVLRMKSAEYYDGFYEIFDLLSFIEKDRVYGIQKVLNGFLDGYQSLIESSKMECHRIFYDNEKELISILSPYLNELEAGWLVRQIGLICYSYGRGISMDGFIVEEVRFINNA